MSSWISWKWDFDFFFLIFNTFLCCLLYQKIAMSVPGSEIWRAAVVQKLGFCSWLSHSLARGRVFRHPLGRNINCNIISFLNIVIEKTFFFFWKYSDFHLALQGSKLFLWVCLISQECLKWSLPLSLHYKNIFLTLPKVLPIL